MRIDCEICGAAYSIDDALISEKGVRARCPQCGTQQVVHPHQNQVAERPEIPSLPAASESIPDWGTPSSPGQPSPFSFSEPSHPGQTPANGDSIPRHPTFPPSASFGEVSGSLQNPFGDHSGSSSARAIARSSSITAMGVSTNPELAMPVATSEGPPEEVGSSLQTAPESAPLSIPAFGIAFGAQPSLETAKAIDSSNGSWNSAPSFASMTDPAVLAPVVPKEPVLEEPTPPVESTEPGEIDRHSPISLESGPSPIELESSQESASSFFDVDEPQDLWQVQTRQTHKTGVPLPQLRNMIRRGAIGKNDEVGRMGEELFPLAHYPDFLTLLPNATGETLSFERKVQGTAVGGGAARPVFWLGAAAMLGAVVYGAATFGPSVLATWNGSDTAGGDPASASTTGGSAEGAGNAPAGIGPNPIDKIRPLWSAQYPKIDGNAASHIDAAEKVARSDTQADYEKADAHYKQALLLEPDNFAAIVGYIENFSHLVDSRVNAEALEFSRSLLAWAKEHFGDRAELFTAQGSLQLASEDLQGARLALAKSMALGDESPRAKMLRARVMLDMNPGESLEISRALFRAGGDFRAAEYLMGAAHRRLGAYVKAKQTFQIILQISPGHRNTLKELAELDLDAGDAKGAVRRLDQLLANEDRDIDAHLLRAKILHQVLNDRELAEKRLRFVIDHMEKEAGPLIRNALVHYAHVLMERKAYDLAKENVERALKLDERYPPSHFAAARLYREQEDFPKAESHLEKAVISANSAEGEEALNQLRTRLGEVQAAGERWTEAENTLSAVIAEQPISPRPYLALAAAYMKQGATAKANVTMRKALNVDPRYAQERLALTDYPEKENVYVDYAATFMDAKVLPDEKSLQSSGAGIAYFHAGDMKKSKAALDRALRIDGKNLGALMYLATMELEGGKEAFARKRLERAARTVGGQHKITKLYLARAEIATRQPQRATKRLTSLIEEDGTLVTARYALGQSYVLEGQKEQGLEQLREVLRVDPSFQPAKKLLFDMKE